MALRLPEIHPFSVAKEPGGRSSPAVVPQRINEITRNCNMISVMFFGFLRPLRLELKDIGGFNMKKLLAPSILAGDWWNIGEQIEAVIRGGADLLHYDVMDGHFVPNITAGPEILSCIRRRVNIPIDVHLMIENPDRYIPAFVEAGANWVSVHIENVPHIHRTLYLIKDLGARAGVVINPGTSLHLLEEALHHADFVLLMSVNPGFSGQTFIERSLERLKALKALRDRMNPNCLIEVDGGIKEENIAEVVRAGADVIVVGSGIFSSEDVEAQTRKLKDLISSSVAV